MAAGTCKIFNSAYETLFQTVAGGGLRQWDDATASSIYWYLCTNTPVVTNTTVANLTLVSGTPGATPVAATSLTVTAGTAANIANTYFDSADVTWGNTVTISSARYLVAAMPQTAAAPGATDELLCFVELETGTTVSSVDGEFSIAAPTLGWFYTNQTP